MITFAIPATRDGEGFGEMLACSLYHKPDGDGALWLNNVQAVTSENRECICRARRVAEALVGKSFTRDLAIELHEPRRNVSGNSWQLILTLGLCSMLTRIPLKPGVTGSGRIREDGSVFSVGSVTEKIIAAKDAGCKIFLVPWEMLRTQKELEGMQVIAVKDIREAWALASNEEDLEKVILESLQ